MMIFVRVGEYSVVRWVIVTISVNVVVSAVSVVVQVTISVVDIVIEGVVVDVNLWTDVTIFSVVMYAGTIIICGEQSPVRSQVHVQGP